MSFILGGAQQISIHSGNSKMYNRKSQTPELRRSKTPKKNIPSKRSMNIKSHVRTISELKQNKQNFAQKEENLIVNRKLMDYLCQGQSKQQKNKKEDLKKTTVGVGNERDCVKCSQREEKISWLQNQLKAKFEQFKKIDSTVKKIQEQYQRKLKKYKAKTKIVQEQFELMKHVLSNRTDCGEIMQQFQRAKLESVKTGAAINKQTLEKSSSKKLLPQQDLADKAPVTQSDKKQAEEEKFNIEQNRLKQTESKNNQNLAQKVNILEQKLLEMQMKKDYTDKVNQINLQSIKKQRETKTTSYQPLSQRRQLNQPMKFTDAHNRDRGFGYYPHRTVVKYVNQEEEQELLDKYERQIRLEREILKGYDFEGFRFSDKQMMQDEGTDLNHQNIWNTNVKESGKQRAMDCSNKQIHTVQNPIFAFRATEPEVFIPPKDGDELSFSKSRYLEKIKERQMLLQGCI